MGKLHVTSYEDFKKTSVFFSLKPSNASFIFLITVCITLVTVFIWSFFFQMDDVVHAQVILRPKQTVSSIRTTSSGEVLQKNYENNQFVQKGDLLLQIDSSALIKEAEEYNRKLEKIKKDILLSEILLQAIKTDEFPKYPKNTEEYSAGSTYLFQKKQFELAVKEARTMVQREKDLPFELKVPQNLQDLQLEYEKRQTELESWKTQSFIQANNNHSSLISSKDNIESRLAELSQHIKNANVFAPISGNIFEVRKVNLGDNIFSSEEIIKIVPNDKENLVADIFVDPSFIAKVRVGNPVKIKVQGLPPSRYGQLETNVTLIPPDAILQEGGKPIFVVQADLDKPYLEEKNGNKTYLLPGITAEARITTDTNTVLQMVINKLWK